MKRIGQLWQQIITPANIELAAQKAVQGRQLSRPMRRFIARRESMLEALHRSLVDETYRFGAFYSFVVHEPKRREIHCPNFFPDRILHHALMNVLVPVFMQKFTADTYGSIKGRGITLLGIRLKSVLRQHPQWYYLQIDINRFYPSVNHHVLKTLLRRMIKCPPTLRMLDAVIDAHQPGLPIGAFPSQYLANLMLSPVDHWAKEVARVPHYYRYMDDILMIVPDKTTAHTLLHNITQQIAALQLTVKPNARIAPVSSGIDFVGYRFFPTHTRLRKRIKLNMQRTVRRLLRAGVDDRTLKRKTASHFGWCKHGDCRNLLSSTFKDRIYLYEKNMEIKRLSEIRAASNWFGLPKEARVSIESLVGQEIVFVDHLTATIRGEPKVVVKAAYPDDIKTHFYFISRSDVLRDRLQKDAPLMPFLATLKRVKNYTIYE